MELLKFLLLLASICCNGPSLAFAQGFRTSSFPFPFYFSTGSKVVVTCWTPSGYEFLHWVNPSNEFISTTNGRYLISRIGSSITLEVNNAGLSDSGSYTCHATRGASPMTSSISVYHAEPIVIFSTSVNATVNVGESHSFFCNATNFIYRQWQYSVPDERAIVLSNTSDDRVTITPDFELQLRDVQFDNEGTYSCVVVNNLGRLTLRNNLTVVAHPEVYIDSSFKEVMENSSATLTCTVTGVPLPTASWRDRSGQNIASAGIQVTNEVLNSSAVVTRLVFAMVGSDQTGPYTCWGVNEYGHQSSATINLRLHDTPEPPQNLTLALVNYTNINVTWIIPQSSVDTYVIMYQALNGSSSGVPKSKRVSSSAGSSALLTGLSRLTEYKVVVYAVNSHGSSPNSNEATIVTTATVPGLPSDVVVLNIGPTFLTVEWPSSSLPQDDGGAPLQQVRLTAIDVQDGRPIPTVSKTVSVDDGSALLEGLQDTNSYQIKVEFSNRMGFGPGQLSNTFQTLQPGDPGSPFHVSARIVNSSVLLCWQDSSSGQPFLMYKFEVEQLGEELQQTFRRNTNEIEFHPDIPGCNKSVKVPGVASDSCYTFKVIAINTQGNGQPSEPSEKVCTPKTFCDGKDCSLSNCEDGKNCNVTVSGSHGLPGAMVIIAVVVPVVVIVIVFTLVVTLCCCCSSARRAKMRKLEKTGQHIPGIDSDRRGSGTKLLSIGRNCSDSFSSTSLNNSPEAQLDQPDTATTLVSNVFDEDFTKSNEAQFAPHECSPKIVSVPHGTFPLTQPVMFTTDGQPRLLQVPQGKYGDHGYPANGSMYPIMENPPSYTHSMNPTGPSNPSAFGYNLKNHEVNGGIIMTDNPNYNDHTVPCMNRGQSSNEREPSGSSTPPPIPPYYGGSMTDVQSEANTNRFVNIPTPYFGESYSQAGYSPDQDRRANRKQGMSTITNVCYGGKRPENANRDTGDVDFVDNDAYETLTTVRGPKFEITGGEKRGAVRETVQIRKH